MPEKRLRDDGANGPPAKKQKKGFQVGPANLPDGSWRRKNQRVKANLIEKAKIKKDYAKIRKKEKVEPSVRYDRDEDEGSPDEQENEKEKEETENDSNKDSAAPASLELHPDRQRLVDEDAQTTPENNEPAATSDPQFKRHESRARRKPKTMPFLKEAREAQQKQQEAEERARQREEASKERERKLQERESFRRTMAKARTGGKNGQRKLGRESKVLLAKVKRMVGEA